MELWQRFNNSQQRLLMRKLYKKKFVLNLN